MYSRDEYHAITRERTGKQSGKDSEQARRNVTWIRFSYGDWVEWRRVLETDRLRHGTESGKPRLIENQGGGSKRHVTTVEFATSPALKQGGIHETQKPKYRGFDDYCFDNNHLNAGDEENTVRNPFSKRLA